MEKDNFKTLNLINGTDSSSFINFGLPEITKMIAKYICRFLTLLLSAKISFLENRAQTTKWEIFVWY